MAFELTKEDVVRLMQEPSATTRANVAVKLAQQIDSPRLTPNEVELAQDIVRMMAKDVENSVRMALAQNLRKAARLPHDVALMLAKDIEDVSLPIIESCLILTDTDLIEIIGQGSAAKNEAIAGRPNVGENVSEVLIDKADEKAVTVLLRNVTAKIAEKSLNKAMERFEASTEVKEALVMRPALPIMVAEKLSAIVSDKLRDYLVSHHELSSTIATDLVMHSRERTVITLSAGGSDADIYRLVQQMHMNKRLTPSIILRALCMGDLTFFEASMAVASGVPLANARILIHDGGRLGLRTLYDKSGMPDRLFPAVRVALDVVHETELDGELHDLERYRARVIERVLTQFEDFGAEDLDYLLSKLSDMLAVA